MHAPVGSHTVLILDTAAVHSASSNRHTRFRLAAFVSRLNRMVSVTMLPGGGPGGPGLAARPWPDKPLCLCEQDRYALTVVRPRAGCSDTS